MNSTKKAGLDDLDQLVPLFDAYRRFYKQPSDPEGAGRFLEERIRKNESVIFLFMQDGKATGFTQLYPIFSSVSMQRAWLLNDLFVHPSARKTGAGTHLLERAKQHGRDTGAKWLLLSTGAENLVAQSLYEKNGWKKSSDIYYEFPL